MRVFYSIFPYRGNCKECGKVKALTHIAMNRGDLSGDTLCQDCTNEIRFPLILEMEKASKGK